LEVCRLYPLLGTWWQAPGFPIAVVTSCFPGSPRDGVWFVDLAPLTDPLPLVPGNPSRLVCMQAGRSASERLTRGLQFPADRYGQLRTRRDASAALSSTTCSNSPDLRVPAKLVRCWTDENRSVPSHPRAAAGSDRRIDRRVEKIRSRPSSMRSKQYACLSSEQSRATLFAPESILGHKRAR